jgi:hypothetical protein
MMGQTYLRRVVHLWVAGRSYDVYLSQLGLAGEPNQATLRRAAARYLRVPEGALGDYQVVRHASGNWTLRPPVPLGRAVSSPGGDGEGKEGACIGPERLPVEVG